jgi:hypothetical protein
MLLSMIPLLVVLVLVAVVILAVRVGSTRSPKEHNAFPVTIIKGGKRVTFDGYDTERLRREIETATARTKPKMPEREAAHLNRMTVAITGDLSQPRAQVAIRINDTKNARFVERVALDTDYLVASRNDTVKARAAAANGTTIITEQQLMECLAAGEFPYHERKHTHAAFNFDESAIVWEETYDPPVGCRLEYADSAGEYSERTVAVLHPLGKHPNGNEYMAAFDNGELKTFRRDRILKLVPLD